MRLTFNGVIKTEDDSLEERIVDHRWISNCHKNLLDPISKSNGL